MDREYIKELLAKNRTFESEEFFVSHMRDQIPACVDHFGNYIPKDMRGGSYLRIPTFSEFVKIQHRIRNNE